MYVWDVGSLSHFTFKTAFPLAFYPPPPSKNDATSLNVPNIS